MSNFIFIFGGLEVWGPSVGQDRLILTCSGSGDPELRSLDTSAILAILAIKID